MSERMDLSFEGEEVKNNERNTINHEFLERLRQQTGEHYAAGMDDDKKFTRDMWKVLRTYDITFLPEFYRSTPAQKIFANVLCLNTSSLTKVIGLLHGTGTWYDNAELLMEEDFYWLNKVISCEEDVFEYLVLHNISCDAAHMITDKVKDFNKTLSQEDIRIMREHACEEWFIESIQKIIYLFTRAENECYALECKSLIYYLVKYRHEYMRIYEDIYKKKVFEWEENETSGESEYYRELIKYRLTE